MINNMANISANRLASKKKPVDGYGQPVPPELIKPVLLPLLQHQPGIVALT